MYKCDKSNSHRKSICIKKYISKYIQCKPPWYSEKEETDITKPCMDSTKLEEYKNVTFELSTNKTLRYETDCYKDNCKQALWKMKKMVDTKLVFLQVEFIDHPNPYKIYFIQLKSIKKE